MTFLKQLFCKHMWYIPKKVRTQFERVEIYDKRLMRHFCRKCRVGEDNGWAHYL